MESKVSVIVPVYNVKNYVQRAVCSILAQSYRKLEVVIVDDGSDDGSEEICKKLAENNVQIKYFRTKNMGLSHARNFGMDKSNGKYIYFMDSDDYIEKEVIKKCVNLLDGGIVDVALIKQKKISIIDGTETEPYPIMRECEKLISNIEAVKMIYNDKLSVTSWSYLTYKQKYVDNQLYFDEGRYHEDQGITPRLFYLSKSMGIVSGNQTSYHYYERVGSIMSTLKSKSIVDCNYMFEKNKDYFVVENKMIFRTIESAIVRYNVDKLFNINPVDLYDNKKVLHLLKSKVSFIGILGKRAGMRAFIKYLIFRIPYLKIIVFKVLGKSFITLSQNCKKE